MATAESFVSSRNTSRSAEVLTLVPYFHACPGSASTWALPGCALSQFMAAAHSDVGRCTANSGRSGCSIAMTYTPRATATPSNAAASTLATRSLRTIPSAQTSATNSTSQKTREICSCTSNDTLALTSGKVTRNTSTRAVAPQSNACSSAPATPRRRRATCAAQPTAINDRLASQAQSGQPDANSESLDATAASHGASMTSNVLRSGPPADAHSTKAAADTTATIPRRRNVPSRQRSATPISTANQSAVVT